MVEKPLNIQKELEILEKKTEDAAQLPLHKEVEELKLILDRLQELKERLLSHDQK